MRARGSHARRCSWFSNDPLVRQQPKDRYVSEGAVVPCPLGIHPLLTITALAERAMIHLARDYGWEMDARDVQPGALEARYRPPEKKNRSFSISAPWRRGEAAGTGGT